MSSKNENEDCLQLESLFVELITILALKELPTLEQFYNDFYEERKKLDSLQCSYVKQKNSKHTCGRIEKRYGLNVFNRSLTQHALSKTLLKHENFLPVVYKSAEDWSCKFMGNLLANNLLHFVELFENTQISNKISYKKWKTMLKETFPQMSQAPFCIFI